MQSGRDVAVQYRELLQLVMHNLSRPGTLSTSEAKSNLGSVSRKIAQCVTELATAAEMLKDDDWVDPSDPTFIAENELLGAAKSIENAAKKLASLKPRREIKGKVSIFSLPYKCFCAMFVLSLSITRVTSSHIPQAPTTMNRTRYKNIALIGFFVRYV